MPHMGEVTSCAIEDLHPPIAGIGDVDLPLLIGGDAPRAVELRRATPSFADLPEILTIARKGLHAMILGIHHQYSPFAVESDV